MDWIEEGGWEERNIWEREDMGNRKGNGKVGRCWEIGKMMGK